MIINTIINFMLINFGLSWSILDVVNCIILIAGTFQKSAQILNVHISYFVEIVYFNKKNK